VVATILLVFVGGFQIFYLWRAVKASKECAEAALLNGQALINSERPWFVAVPQTPEIGEYPPSYFGAFQE
ncbi:MAG TPA: hypothetical protein VI455_01740, partial [Terriglobia bacterium]